MDMDYIRKRITQLRMARGLSEYQLSYNLGHSKNYIHNIVTGHSQPSVIELLYLIEYLGVSPRDFFDEEQQYKEPILAKEIMEGIKGLDKNDLDAILRVVQQLNSKNK